MARKKLSPPDLVAARFEAKGICEAHVCRKIQRHPTSINTWRARGRIPNTRKLDEIASTHQLLLLLAKKEGVRLTAAELNEGGVP